ncbi:hypothetical protein G7Y89_g7062 [Cudoniella acicularis]|uniref:Major facilitator superfamily (MFS) profile domain-containing protein n=1 Tax=Cudoniella acicularis TaxID=354080 RepID=A0A8H4RK32_9HELO|nr:hypothetical protein G7Y89_g7062 [Cudoniella acicularis]
MADIAHPPRFTRANVMIMLSVCLGSVCYGYNFSVASFTIGQPAFYAYMGLSTNAYSNSMIDNVLGLFAAGAVFGAIFVGWFCDAYGRKKSLVVAAIINIVGGALSAGSVQIGMFIVARFVTGFAAAMFVALVPIYISEIAPPAIRGFLVGQHGLSVRSAMSDIKLMPHRFRFPVWVHYSLLDLCWDSIFINSGFSVALPSGTPMFLAISSAMLCQAASGVSKMAHGRSDEAWDILGRLHYSDTDPSQAFAREEFFQITTQLAADQAKYGDVSVLDLFRRPEFRKRMIAAAIIMATSQATGNLVIYSNIAILYQGLGLSNTVSLVVSGAYITWACVMNFVNSTFLDRMGRVTSLIIGFASGACIIAIETALVATYSGTTNHAGLSAAVAMLFAYITTYAGFCDTTIYVYCAEVFPTHIRAKGMAWSIAVFMMTDIPFLETFTLGVSEVGWRYYLVFIVMAIVGVPAIWYFCPETKGLSLEEINGLFGDDVVVNLTHITEEERLALEEKMKAGAAGKDGESSSVSKSIPIDEKAVV